MFIYNKFRKVKLLSGRGAEEFLMSLISGWEKHFGASCFQPPSLPIGQSLQEGDDRVLFGGQQLQGGGYPAEGLRHPHLPPLSPLLSGLHPAAGHPIQAVLLLLPLQNLLERKGAGLLLVSFPALSLSC